jgi:hypothetical protein
MRETIFHKVKRHIEQFFETEYWYRFRKLSFFWFDDETNKYIERKERARELTTITWDGEKDILGMMLLKIDHMYHNLKHHAAQSNFYFDSYVVLEHGTLDDKIWAFHKILETYEWNRSKKEKDWECSQFNYVLDDGAHENRFVYGYDANDKPLYYIRRWNTNGTVEYFYGHKNSLFSLNKGLDAQDKTCLAIIEGVIQYVYSVNIPVTEFYKLSDGLKPYARGNRRTLTQLLHLRHMVKKLYLIEDTDDKYSDMWMNIKDPDKQRAKLHEAEELYLKDRQDLYHAIADFMAEHGRGWWD